MLDYRVRFVLCVLGLLAFLFVGMACSSSDCVCSEGEDCPCGTSSWGVLPVLGWRRMSARGRMFLLLLLAIAFMGMACADEPGFNPNPLGDAMGISDRLGDVTDWATGQGR